MLHLESEAMGSIPTGGNILSLDFFCFHTVKTKMPIFAFLCVCEKLVCIAILYCQQLSVAPQKGLMLFKNAIKRFIIEDE